MPLRDLTPDDVPDPAPGTLADLPPGAQPDTYRGSILPFSTDAQGKPHLDWNAGVIGGLIDAVKLPGQVLSGEVQTPYSSTGQADPNLIPRTANLAMTMVMDKGPNLTYPRTPTAEDLKAAAQANYTKLQGSNLNIAGSAVADLASNTMQHLTDDRGIIAETAPKTFSLLNKLAEPPKDGFMSWSGLDAARQGFSDLSLEPGTEGFAAQRARSMLDDFRSNLRDSQMVQPATGAPPTMTPEAASQLYDEARSNYGAAMRSNDLTGTLDKANTGIVERAENRAAAANSGENLDNAIRSRVATFLQNPKNLAGFSGDEIKALNDVVQGSSVQNFMRWAGNQRALWSLLGMFLGGEHSGGIGAAVGGTAAQIGTSGLKAIENMMARRRVNAVDEMVRQNSPLGQQMPPGMTVSPMPPLGGRVVLPVLLTTPPKLPGWT